MIHPRSVPPMHLHLRISLVFCSFLLVAATSFQLANGFAPFEEQATDPTPLRKAMELSGWRVKAQGSEEWKAIKTDDSWETVLGVKFDGVAIYEAQLPPVEKLHESGRLLLHFDAVATHATVRLDGNVIGEHLGGWTPFRIDITDRYRAGAVLRVEVDEKVGHNTQGFLPVFLPHFGGIWKPVSLIQTSGSAFLDDLTLFAGGWTDDKVIVKASVQSPVHNEGGIANASLGTGLEIGLRELGYRDEAIEWRDIGTSGAPVQFEKSRPASEPWIKWSPASPKRYRFEALLREKSTKRIVDRYSLPVSVRRIETKGREIYLNGEPVVLRGVLNWGYAPPRLCPTHDEAWMRRELVFAKERGFNMMKFCLWVPPKRYLDLCDELGIFAWMEYPTWHPKLTKEFRHSLVSEYEEFFAYDRNHPSVVLRSLTCETGHSADIDVVRELYDRAHRAIPGAIVEDDSSWIGWHRVHDIYDDHPYGNNHTWQQTLQRLEEHIAQRDPKPLVLGEAIAADTWYTQPDSVEAPTHPHQLLSANQLKSAIQRLENYLGETVDPRSSFSYAMEMRKFQIERYRFQMPRQGYTVSVLRDFPFASMGLIDFFDRPKSTPSQWSWHRDQMIALETNEDRRSFFRSELVSAKLHFMETRGRAGIATVQWNGKTQAIPMDSIGPATRVDPRSSADRPSPSRNPDAIVSVDWSAEPQVARQNSPAPIAKQTLAVRWSNDDGASAESVTNTWNIWLVDHAIDPSASAPGVRHSSAEGLQLGKELDSYFSASWKPSASVNSVAIARRLDRDLLDWVLAGGKLVLLPDGGVGSLITTDHWFLRGAPMVSRTHVGDEALAAMAEELQSMDLGGPVLRAPDYLDEVESWALLWDNHDIAEVRIHSQCWGARIGKGQMWVSTMAFAPERGAACSRWIEQGVKSLTERTYQRGLSEETIARLKFDLENPQVELPRKGWYFKPDPKNQGLEERWHLDTEAAAAPQRIEIAKQWDGQGYQGLDGWAWYVQRVVMPKDVDYLVFTGVDDYFEVYVDGVQCGRGGDRDTKQTAFEQTVAIPLPRDRQESVTLAIRVEDWQGAGGIFRPVYMTKQIPPTKPSLLRREIANASD
ncbi:glycoside hydrolase family 2 TIM barrel-domain containing protein [Pirellulaceae bacterium SH501]